MPDTYNGFKMAKDGASLVDAEGVSHSLRQKSLRVFEQLALSEGSAVSKQQLIDSVWKDVAVTDDSLIQCVAEIRRLLGDGDKQVLQTIPRFGYRLIPDKRVKESTPAWRTAISVGLVGIVCIAVTVWGLRNYPSVSQPQSSIHLETHPAILITQFEDLTGMPRWQRLASGLTSELVIELAKNKWLRILRLSSEQELTSKMNEVTQPRFVISGSLQADAEHLRVTSQLKKIPENEIVWSERWEAPAHELFAVQDEILKKINVSLGAAWTGVVAQHGLSQAIRKPTDSLDAYELYLLGLEHKHKFTREGNEKAINYLKKAITIDPHFGQAWSVLSIVFINAGDLAESDTEVQSLMEQQLEAASRAYELIPENPEAIISYSWVKTKAGDQSSVDSLLQRAVNSSWNNPDVLAYATWAGSGRASEKLDVISWGKRAIELNPDHPEWYLTALAAAQLRGNEPEGALKTLQNTSEAFYRWLYEAGSFALLGDIDNARTTSLKALDINPGYTIAGEMLRDPILDPIKRSRWENSLTAAGFK